MFLETHVLDAIPHTFSPRLLYEINSTFILSPLLLFYIFLPHFDYFLLLFLGVLFQPAVTTDFVNGFSGAAFLYLARFAVAHILITPCSIKRTAPSFIFLESEFYPTLLANISMIRIIANILAVTGPKTTLAYVVFSQLFI